MEDLVSSEKKAFKVEWRKRVVNPRDPLRHAHVIGVLGHELELEEGARSFAHKAVSLASNAAIGRNACQGRTAIGY